MPVVKQMSRALISSSRGQTSSSLHSYASMLLRWSWTIMILLYFVYTVKFYRDTRGWLASGNFA